MKGCRLYYPMLALPEAYATLFKLLRRQGLNSLPPQALRGLAVLHSGLIVKMVEPHALDAKLAFDVLSRGWRDFFDAIIYATAKRLNTPLLTLDQSFYRFLEREGFDTSLVLLVERRARG